jgi:hypothetical protein
MQLTKKYQAGTLTYVCSATQETFKLQGQFRLCRGGKFVGAARTAHITAHYPDVLCAVDEVLSFE